MDAQKRIKQLMEERGWTDYRLAKEANLSHSTITNLFKRNNAPTLPTLEVICRAFGITLTRPHKAQNDRTDTCRRGLRFQEDSLPARRSNASPRLPLPV